MPTNNFSNGSYEKVSMLDEVDENDNCFVKTPFTETRMNGSGPHKYDLFVSVSILYQLLILTIEN